MQLKPTKDVRRDLLRQAFQRQRGRCCWCGCQMKLPASGKALETNTATREHMVPKLFGGPMSKGNIKAACFKCNCERGAKMHQSLEAERLKGMKPAAISGDPQRTDSGPSMKQQEQCRVAPVAPFPLPQQLPTEVPQK